MNKVGRKIYFDNLGNVIVDLGERQGAVIATTVEQDITIYTALSERNRETFDVLELPFGAYARDFAICTGYRVDVETKELFFSYNDPSEPEAEPVFETPLSERVEELNTRTELNESAIDFLLMGGGF